MWVPDSPTKKTETSTISEIQILACFMKICTCENYISMMVYLPGWSVHPNQPRKVIQDAKHPANLSVFLSWITILHAHVCSCLNRLGHLQGLFLAKLLSSRVLCIDMSIKSACDLVSMVSICTEDVIQYFCLALCSTAHIKSASDTLMFCKPSVHSTALLLFVA